MKRGLALAILFSIFILGLSPANAAIRKWSVEPGIYGGPVLMDADLFVEDPIIFGGSLAFSVLPAFQVEIISSSLTADSQRDSARSGAELKMDTVGIRLLGTFLAEEDIRVMPVLGIGTGNIETEGTNGSGRRTFKKDASYSEAIFGARISLWRDINLRAAGVLRHGRTIDTSGSGTTHVNFQVEIGVSVWLFGAK
jgi:hypothetical protein